MQINKEIQAIVIDDDFFIRQILIRDLKILDKNISEKLSVYACSNGLDGLGAIFVLNPQIIVIDSTLPKYSGREVIEFLTSNDNFQTDEKIIIVMIENEKLDLPSNFLQIKKSDHDFTQQLFTAISLFLNHSKFNFIQDKKEIASFENTNKIVNSENRSLSSNIFKKIFHRTYSFVYFLINNYVLNTLQLEYINKTSEKILMNSLSVSFLTLIISIFALTSFMSSYQKVYSEEFSDLNIYHQTREVSILEKLNEGPDEEIIETNLVTNSTNIKSNIIVKEADSFRLIRTLMIEKSAINNISYNLSTRQIHKPLQY